VAAALPALREAVARAGRDPAAIRVVPMGSIPQPGKLEHFRDIGLTEVVLNLESAGRDEVLPVLDRYAAVVEPYRD